MPSGAVVRSMIPAPRIEDLYRLADAVAAPGDCPAYLLDRDNKALSNGHRIPIAKALAALGSGGAATFAVDPAPEVLALDADTEQASAWLTALVPELKGLGLWPVVLGSGQPDRLHLFCLCDSSDQVKEIGTRAHEHGADWRREKSGIRPPGAPHRCGWPVSPVSPVSWGEVIDYLTNGRSVTRPRRGADPKEVVQFLLGKLSPGGRDALYAPGADRLYKSRSERLWAVLVALSNAAHAAGLLDRMGDLAPVLLPILLAEPGGAKLVPSDGRRREAADVEKRLHRELHRAVAFVRRSPPVREDARIREVIERVHGAVMRSPWTRSSGSDRAVLQAVLNLAATAGKLELHASGRVVAERAGVSGKTAAVSLHRLAAAGWLKAIEESRYARAARWLIVDQLEAVAQPVPQDESVHDLWRRHGGLGPVARGVWRSLTADAQPIGALVGALGRSGRTATINVRFQLRRLEACGLAVQCEDGWKRGELSPNVAVVGRRCEGAADRQAREHGDQRVAFRAVCAVWQQQAQVSEDREADALKRSQARGLVRLPHAPAAHRLPHAPAAHRRSLLGRVAAVGVGTAVVMTRWPMAAGLTRRG